MPNRTETNRIIDSEARTVSANVTNSGTVTHSGTNTFSGAVVHTGSRRMNVITTATTLTLTAATHGGTIVLVTAKAKAMTLPSSPAAGTVFTIVQELASTGAPNLLVDMTGTNKINGGAAGKGLTQTVASNENGDSVTLISDGTDYWTIGKIGTWAAES
jgi:hypothetical protein